MAGFLYFADGIVNPITDDVIGHLDLRYAFVDRSPATHKPTGRTPSGNAGTIMVDPRRIGDRDPVYSPDPTVQTWRKRPGDDCVWIGHWVKAKPTAADLARSEQLAGDALELADGNKWQIPKFVFHAGESGFELALPTYYDLDEKGMWVCGDVEERYQPFAELADRFYAGVYLAETPGGRRLTTKEILAAAPRLLSINYVVSPIECAMLRLFKKGGVLRRIAEATVDYETAMAWLKKNVEEISPLAGGG